MFSGQTVQLINWLTIVQWVSWSKIFISSWVHFVLSCCDASSKNKVKKKRCLLDGAKNYNDLLLSKKKKKNNGKFQEFQSDDVMVAIETKHCGSYIDDVIN